MLNYSYIALEFNYIYNLDDAVTKYHLTSDLFFSPKDKFPTSSNYFTYLIRCYK